MTEEELIEARQQRYGRRRSQSIDYGSRGGGDHNFEQVLQLFRYYVDSRSSSAFSFNSNSKNNSKIPIWSIKLGSQLIEGSGYGAGIE